MVENVVRFFATSKEAPSISESSTLADVSELSKDVEFVLPRKEFSKKVELPFALLNANKEKFLMKYSCVSIISDCLNQLTVLSKVFSSLIGEVGLKEIVTYRSLDERYKLINEKSSFGDFIINASYTNLHKLLKEISALKQVFKEIIQEIAVFGDTASMDLYLETVENMKLDEEHLFEEVHKKEQTFKELLAAYRNYRAEMQKRCKELDTLAQVTVGGMKDDLENAQAERTFTKKWEMARREQNTMMLENSESFYKKIITNMTTQMELENRCHDEIAKYLEEVTNDYREDIEKWMDKHEKALDDREMEIVVLRNKTDQILEDIEKSQFIYETRAQEIESFLEWKEQKKAIKQRHLLEISAAIKIQAWWRETMMRKFLGPYKKKKKEKKGKKK